MGFRKQTKGLNCYFDGAATPLPLSSVWLDYSTLLPLQQVDVTAIIHAFQPSTQSHPQIKRVFGSASGVDPLRLKKKTRQNVPRGTKPARKKHAQTKRIAPIYKEKHRHPTPHPPTYQPMPSPLKKPTAPKKCSTWNTAAEIAALILICVTLGALLGANF